MTWLMRLNSADPGSRPMRPPGVGRSPATDLAATLYGSWLAIMRSRIARAGMVHSLIASSSSASHIHCAP
jgi:hypothetical protein